MGAVLIPLLSFKKPNPFIKTSNKNRSGLNMYSLVVCNTGSTVNQSPLVKLLLEAGNIENRLL